MTIPAGCSCCSCDETDPDVYCRAHGTGVTRRQCDTHGSTGIIDIRNPVIPVSVESKRAGGAP
jgi:hypothetical protein